MTHIYEWIRAPDTDSTYGIYLNRGGVKYPLAIIELNQFALGANDLESLLHAAPDLLAACEHGHNDDDDAWLWRIFNFLAAAPTLLATCEYTLEAICAGMDSLTMDEVETQLGTIISEHLNNLDDLAEKFRIKMQKEYAAISKAQPD